MASGTDLVVFTPLMYVPTATNFATLSMRNRHPILVFDPSTDWNSIFPGLLPHSYSGGGITLEIHFSSVSTTGAVRWQAAFERIGTVLDVDADSFATAQSAGTTVPATTGLLAVTTILFTDGAQIDSLAAGEAFRLKINRDADGTSGTDDSTGVAELHRVLLRET
jgi:hypothetical protein